MISTAAAKGAGHMRWSQDLQQRENEESIPKAAAAIELLSAFIPVTCVHA